MKNALVTGVSRGIGREITHQLIEDGHKVFGVYKFSEVYQEEKAEAEKLKSELGDNLELLPYDLNSRENLQTIIGTISETILDVIINNAGEVFLDKWEEFSIENWDRTIKVNLEAPLLLVHGLRNNLQSGSSIVNIASVDGDCAAIDTIAYAASKAGLMNLTKSLGAVLGPKGIRVNAVAPGWVETEMTKDTMPDIAKELTPLKRNAKAKDVADVVSFLVSDKAGFINGQTITVDGGLTTIDYTLYKEADL